MISYYLSCAKSILGIVKQCFSLKITGELCPLPLTLSLAHHLSHWIIVLKNNWSVWSLWSLFNIVLSWCWYRITTIDACSTWSKMSSKTDPSATWIISWLKLVNLCRATFPDIKCWWAIMIKDHVFSFPLLTLQNPIIYDFLSGRAILPLMHMIIVNYDCASLVRTMNCTIIVKFDHFQTT